jgi:hypothetical protein
MLSVGFLSSLPACLPALVRLAQQQQQQLSSSPAGANSFKLMPLAYLLYSVRQLLNCWPKTVDRVPSVLPVVVRTLLPLVQQLQGCGSLLLQQQQHAVHRLLVRKLAAAAAAAAAQQL